MENSNAIALGFTKNASIGLDFDGVIHGYKNGWQGISNIKDKPVKGVKSAIILLRSKGYKILIYSTRCVKQEGRKAISDYLKKWEITVDGISKEKPACMCYVDDRSIQFNGDWPKTIKDIVGFENYIDKEMRGKKTNA